MRHILFNRFSKYNKRSYNLGSVTYLLSSRIKSKQANPVLFCFVPHYHTLNSKNNNINDYNKNKNTENRNISNINNDNSELTISQSFGAIDRKLCYKNINNNKKNGNEKDTNIFEVKEIDHRFKSVADIKTFGITFLKTTFLPHDYPDSVAPNYLRYVSWQ
eukprot:Pgem_evm1s3752